jgi:hypothetical protein
MGRTFHGQAPRRHKMVIALNRLLATSRIVRHGTSGRSAHRSWEPGRQPWRVCLFEPDGAWRSRCRWDAQSVAVTLVVEQVTGQAGESGGLVDGVGG